LGHTNRRDRFKERDAGEAPLAMGERSARLAENEAVFRAGNERIDAVLGDALELTPYICECGDPECFERVDLTSKEYEEVRSHPARFFVVAGHEDLTAGEVVVEEASRFKTVEKRGAERVIVERSDPRAP
jgi:hypothetical protein